MTRLMTLQERYNRYKKEFKRTGDKPDISLLLALLLLKDKDKFKSNGYELASFYNQNKKEIDSRIDQVMRDFSISIVDLKKENIYIKMGNLRTDEEVKYDQFKNGIIMLMMVVNSSQICNPEEMYNIYCNAFEWECLPKISAKEVPYSNLSPLQRKYRQYLNRYKRDGRRPHPAVLLLLLMLLEKDKYQSGSSNEHALYSKHSDKIEAIAQQIIRDFELDKQSVSEKVMDDDGNIDIHKFIVEYGFNIALPIIAFENRYNPSKKAEEIYDFWLLYINRALRKEAPSLNSDILCINSEELSEEQYCQLALATRYQYHKRIWELKHIHPNPNELLAILLLMNKNDFALDDCKTTKEFYYKFWREINSHITSVMTEFEMDDDDLEDFELEIGFGEESVDLSQDEKRFLVFKPAIETLMDSLKNEHIPVEAMHNCLRLKYKANNKKIQGVQRRRYPRKRRRPWYSTSTTGFNF